MNEIICFDAAPAAATTATTTEFVRAFSKCYRNSDNRLTTFSFLVNFWGNLFTIFMYNGLVSIAAAAAASIVVTIKL